MRLETVATHTFDADLLPDHALVLDAGCRYFDFAIGMRSSGCRVLAIDADRDLWNGSLLAGWKALVGIGKPPTGRFISAGVGSRVVFDSMDGDRVSTVTIADVVREHGHLDLVKLDIEGSEYDVLLTWPGPVATQISVEFHEHLGVGVAVHGADAYDRIIAHLGQWYRLMQHEATPFDGGVNYYDSLWVLK